MPLSFAFKIAARAGQIGALLDRELDLEIARITGGLYCHVEAWIDGPVSAALCFSSRQPIGTYFATLDLTDKTLWRIVNVPTTPMEDAAIMGFCVGTSGRRYDTFGILGIGLSTTVHDPYDRICSETCFEIAADVLHRMPPGIERWQVAPSGLTCTGKRYGFFELLTALPGVTIAA